MLVMACLFSTKTIAQNFAQSQLNLNGLSNISADAGVTSLMYGPDDRLYVAQYPGTIEILSIERNGLNDYVVTSVETLTGVKDIVNHDDDGSPCSGIGGVCSSRETTGLTVAGTASNPIIYVTSSDFRIGAGAQGNGDVDLDTNSGVITRFSWTGTEWEVVDLVRGLPRSEENHATNGLEVTTINGKEYLVVASGGITNAGSPSANFVYTNEYALSGAILSVDLDAINALPVQTDSNGRDYIYDLPTLDDPTRPNVNGITDPDTPGYDGIDVNDPWGGNDGLNQAMVVPDGPVQVLSPGYRNAYDLVVTESGALYVTDNGANLGWGGFPVNEGTASVNNDYDPNEPGSQSVDEDGEKIGNHDHLEMVTTDLQSYTFGSYYAGHPNPTRANPTGAGLFTAPAQIGTDGAVFRTQVYDPDLSTPGSTDDPSIALPANWPPVPIANANIVEGDWRGPDSSSNPDGPDDTPVLVWQNNTNGIDEYTASNFGGAMQGDLIAGSNKDAIRRVQLLGDGTVDTYTQSFFSGIGGNSLGITCNSDTDVFPGTIWAGTLNGLIVVFEPQDFVQCDNPEAEPLADYDNDGYTNQDELDNGTDPCNGGSQPSDFDKSAGAPLISDFNDDDDDNDGILDKDDPFQLGDPTVGGSDAFTIPIRNDLFNDQQGLGGIYGLGMTGLMNNGDTGANWLNWLDVVGEGPNQNDVLGGAPGIMTSHMTDGTALGSSNNQDKGYQYGVQVDNTTGPFTVIGGMNGFTGPLRLYENTDGVTGGELGFFIGDGTQSNYIKFVVTTDGFTALQEVDDVPDTPISVTIPIIDRPDAAEGKILFYFRVDPVAETVDLEYQIDDNPKILLGQITALGNVLQAIQSSGTDLAVGFIGTSNTPGKELEGSWDILSVLGQEPIVIEEIPNIDRIIGSADEDINLNNYYNDDDGTANLIYTVSNNSDPNVGTAINSNILTLSYPSVATTSDLTIRATDGEGNFVEDTFTINVLEGNIVLYRVNSGGAQIAAIDGDIDWEEDTTGNNSQYLSSAASNDSYPGSITTTDGSVDNGATPIGIFARDRYDDTPGAPNLKYSFPVPESGNYEVRLYMGDGFSGTAEAGSRIFDVTLEGLAYPLLTDIDLSGTYGSNIGTMITHTIAVNDGTLDIEFLHGEIQNPLVNGIEILDATDADTPIYVYSIADRLSYTDEVLDGSFTVQAVGGDGNFQYSAIGLPPGVTLEPTNGQIGGTIDTNAFTNSPYNVTITVDDSDGFTNDEVEISFTWGVVEPYLYRINAGGDQIAASGSGVTWEDDLGNGGHTGNSYSVNTGLTQDYNLILSDNRDSSIPAYMNDAIFESIFNDERYDESTAPEMEYTLPVENGDYVVNLYLGNSWDGSSGIGERVFDILLEGVVVENDLDLVERFGHQIGGMVSYPVTVSDSELNISFGHEVQNPLVNAIEVYLVDSANPTFALTNIADQTNSILDNVDFTASTTGGDDTQNVTYYISGQPDGLSIDSSTGQIFGTIGVTAATGGPNSDGNHSVMVTAVKPLSAPSNLTFKWTVEAEFYWTDKDEDENYTARHENSFVQAGDKFYLMGGRENAPTVDIYDYNADSWTSVVNSTSVDPTDSEGDRYEFNHFQATEYKGLIWVIGAFKNNDYPNEVPAEYIWMFDPATQEWIKGPQIPEGRRRGSAGLALYNDKFYVAGGNNDGHDGGYVAQFDEYDPATGTWTPLTDMPRARDHFSTVIIGDKLYAAGGRLTGGTGGAFKPLVSEVDVYDFTSGTWSTLPSDQNIPTPRAGAAAVNFNDKLIVIGGEVQNELVYGVSTDDALSITEEYDPVTQTWDRLPDMNYERQGIQAIVSGPGVHVLGGSPNRGGGNQKNLEYLGEDAPVGTPIVGSALSAPTTVVFNDGETLEIDLDVIDGNTGLFISSMEVTGADAADYSIVSGALTNILMDANSSHTLSVALSGTGADRTATLTINYGGSSTLNIALTNNADVAFGVTNPGDQYNYEGDAVSLQIEATSPNNTTYSATGLPPSLTINENTGIITGTIDEAYASGSGDNFIEENGLVIIEAESGDTTGWDITNLDGETGIIANTNS
ncbi:Putative Ig domain-containing protein [Flagellimonas zhangzhouensis]|uniref:Putative Ig domain-containing protein n=3 Tax=Flagellimonas zhangzhouensis TaxID=1073328 RepID=A0A1H2YRX5_9FLAO|nr:Putative Ig domain-containing protein [Allomuricauda zhangzhouensis]